MSALCFRWRVVLTSVANANPNDTLLLMYTQQCSFAFQRPCASQSRVRLPHDDFGCNRWELCREFGRLPYVELVSNWRAPLEKVSSGSSDRFSSWSQSRPRGWTSKRAIIGVMLTLGYLKEKNKLVEDPRTANKMERAHMRGVLMDSDKSSVAATDARTWAYGELSEGWLWSFTSCKSSLSDDSSSSSAPSIWLLVDDD